MSYSRKTIIAGYVLLAVLSVAAFIDVMLPSLTWRFVVTGAILVAGWVFYTRRSRLHLQSEKASITDELTGLYNRRYLMNRLLEAKQEVKLAGGSLCFAMLDIDGFKTFNDSAGHVQGDQRLVAVAETVRKVLPDGVLGFRYGGDEFALLFTSAHIQQATRCLERLVEALRDLDLSVSIGVCQYPGLSGNGSDIILMADQALLRAKRQGKGQIVPKEAL